jgi:hypothetical protein
MRASPHSIVLGRDLDIRETLEKHTRLAIIAHFARRRTTGIVMVPHVSSIRSICFVPRILLKGEF